MYEIAYFRIPDINHHAFEDQSDGFTYANTFGEYDFDIGRDVNDQLRAYSFWLGADAENL